MAAGRLGRYLIVEQMTLDHSPNLDQTASWLRSSRGLQSAPEGVLNRLESAYSLTEVMEIVTHSARLLLAADGITFVIRDGELCHYAEEDAISPLWKGSRFPIDMCISGWCMKQQQAVAIPDIYLDDRIPHDAYRPTFVKSLAMVPVVQVEAIAAMGAYWASRYDASEADIVLLQKIADAAAPAIARILRS